MSRVACVLIGLAATSGAAAPRALSVEEAMRIAIEKSEAIVIAQAGVDRAAAAETRAWSAVLPQIDGTVSYDRTLASEYEGLFDTASIGPAFADLPFGQPNNWRAGIAVSETLFDAPAFVGILAAQPARTASEINVETARAQAVIEVVRAYYDVVLADQLLSVAARTLVRAEQTYALTRIEVQNGQRPEVEELRARVNFDNQRPVVQRRVSARSAALLRLKRLIDVPLDEDFELALTDDLEGAPDELTRAALDVVEIGLDDMRARAALRQAEAMVEIRDAAVLAAWAQYLPRLSIDLSYGAVNYPDALWPVFDELRNNWIVGARLQLPIFSGFRRQSDVATAEADRMEARALMRSALERDDVESHRVEHDIVDARATFEATAGVVEDAERALSIAELRYREGIGTQLELDDAQLQLDQAQVNRAVAARDLRIALLQHALLPLLPIGGG